jgi:hypothetical protein
MLNSNAMKIFVLPTYIAICASPAYAGDKILVGPHFGSGTILSISGINSDHAALAYRIETDDLVESCVRNTGNDGSKADSDLAAECTRKALNNPRSIMNGTPRVTKRRAFCSRATIYTEFGNFSMVDHEKEPSVTDGRKPVMIRTDWKDHTTGEILSNGGASNTDVIIDTFRILCPKWYDGIAKGGMLY